MLQKWLFVCLLSVLALAQDNKDSSSMSRCEYSCPPTDLASVPLAKRPKSVGFDSFYSMFDCTYFAEKSKLPEHTCRYDKSSGKQIIGASGDQCPEFAPECPGDSSSSDNSPPMFSEEKYEIPSWVESGRYPVWLKEHHRP